jgi:ribonuclease D
VPELWLWRDREAARRDCPVKRVLPDDLIVERAKRRSADPKQVRAGQQAGRRIRGRFSDRLTPGV